MRVLYSIIGFFIYFFKNKVVDFFIHHYLYSKYYRKAKKIGKGVRFNGISHITGLNNIEIASNVHIGSNAKIRGEGGLTIGENTHISTNLVIYTHSHDFEGSLLPYDSKMRYKKVIIEKNVWIGTNVIILPGTHIHEGVIIGAGAVVHGEIPALSIYGASAGKLIKHRKKDHYDKLDSDKKYGGKNGQPLF